ncbi:MAG: DUF6151 family protein [Myxococcota bacterium]
MTVDVPIRCSCGALRGIVRGVSGQNGNRLVCYCDDCQSFAHFLGRADEVLDAHGGTDIFQTTPVHIEITEGADRLACMRLTAGGLLRWYADCCKTPIGNTRGSRRVPFVGVVHSCMDHAADIRFRDEALGAVRARINGRFAKGDLAQLSAHQRAPVSMLRVVPMMLFAWLRGESTPSPFFDAATGKPRVVPRILSEDELREVVAARDAVSG